MFGPGEYVPDPTEGIVNANALPQPLVVPYDRNHDHSPCPRCGHFAYRHKSGQRTLHDLGDLAAGCPIDLLVTYSSHYCSHCRKYFNSDLSDLGRVDELFNANPRGHKMNECEKGLAQFLIPRGNASKLFEFVKEPFHLLP